MENKILKKEIIRKKLIEMNDNRCSICGKEFDGINNIPVIDCIVPYSKGGEYVIDNLQLTCGQCNTLKGNMEINSEIFKRYIINMVNKSKIYKIIPEKLIYDYGIDLIIKTKKEYKMCQIGTSNCYTMDRINAIIYNIKKAEKQLNKKYFPITSIFIFPGKLSAKNLNQFKSKGIEVWDRDYLVSQFNNEILEINSTYLNKILNLFMQEPSKDKGKNQYQHKIEELKMCKSGTENWSRYQKLIKEIVELLFCPKLDKPIEELYDQEKANRRDIIMPNYSIDGFWKFMRENYKADYVVIDAKNSGRGIKKQDILQIANYLKPHGTGLFGIIVARKYNQNIIKSTLKEIWAIENKMIIVLNDVDIEEMLNAKMRGEEPETIIRQKIEDFRLSI